MDMERNQHLKNHFFIFFIVLRESEASHGCDIGKSVAPQNCMPGALKDLYNPNVQKTMLNGPSGERLFMTIL